MYVWIIETFDREDKWCEYNYNVEAVFSEDHFKEAKGYFDRACKNRTEKGDEIEEWEDNKGYHFTSENGEYESYKMSYVGLIKKEVM